MKEIKKFNVLKGFTIFFTILVVLAFAGFFVLTSKGTQNWVLGLLADAHPEYTSEVLNEWGQWAILSAMIAGILQIIFMHFTFSAAKTAIKKNRARTIQTSIYVANSKEEKKMRKAAVKENKKAVKMQKKLDKKEAKKVKKEQPVLEEPKPKEVVKEQPKENKKSHSKIDDILNSMK